MNDFALHVYKRIWRDSIDRLTSLLKFGEHCLMCGEWFNGRVEIQIQNQYRPNYMDM